MVSLKKTIRALEAFFAIKLEIKKLLIDIRKLPSALEKDHKPQSSISIKKKI